MSFLRVSSHNATDLIELTQTQLLSYDNMVFLLLFTDVIVVTGLTLLTPHQVTSALRVVTTEVVRLPTD